MENNYSIKKVTIEEINSVMEIIGDAIELLGKNSLQWQQGYPNIITMSNDINNSNLYGLYDNNYLIGIIALIKGIEKSYLNIYDGSWINKPNENDLVIHRIAVRNGYHNKHIGAYLMNYAYILAKNLKCVSIKADTHILNIPMQYLLDSCGYKRTGTIYLSRDEVDNSRIAFELNLL